MEKRTSYGVPYQTKFSLEGADEITDFRQTNSCFNAHEINPAIGCDFFCQYCSMYAQNQEMDHEPITIFTGYPEYLKNYIENSNDPEKLIFNLSPKTDIFSPALVESGMAEAILEVLNHYKVKYYILTKSGLPNAGVQKLLQSGKDHNQLILSCGLPDETIERILEPGAPVAKERMEFAKWCKSNDIRVTGIIAPYLPIEEGDSYPKKMFNMYSKAGIRHASIQILKLSMECLDRMCKLLPFAEQRLRQLYNEDSPPIEWRLPGGKTVTRYYAHTKYLKVELNRLKQIAKEFDITISACKDVCIKIEDQNFNKEGLVRGFNCVGYTRA